MPKRNSAITLSHTIICDDIRREDNGKFILIGVYPEMIMLNMLPAQLILSIWMQFKMQILEKTTLEFEIKGSALQEPITFTFEIGDENLFGKDEAVPLIVKLPFNIQAAGGFTIYFRKKGDREWQAAQTIHIKRAITPSLQ